MSPAINLLKNDLLKRLGCVFFNSPLLDFVYFFILYFRISERWIPASERIESELGSEVKDRFEEEVKQKLHSLM